MRVELLPVQAVLYVGVVRLEEWGGGLLFPMERVFGGEMREIVG